MANFAPLQLTWGTFAMLKSLHLAMLTAVYWPGARSLEPDCLGLNPSCLTLGNLLTSAVPWFTYLQSEVKMSPTF